VWPDDKQLKDAFRTNPTYKSLRSEQIGAVLKIINDYLATPKTEQVTVHSLSVEHIMPQAWNEHYPLDGDIVSPEMVDEWSISDDEDDEDRWRKVDERDRKIHTLGNLTIVTRPLNSAMKNAPFTEKKKDLRNSILILNRYFDNLENWDEKEIDRRAFSLFETAIRIWDGPLKEQ
jgi:hypothetical protein